MWYQFFLENFHFAISLVAALVFFAVFWLYFDAWLSKKSFVGLARALGFLFLALSFVAGAVKLESSIISVSLVNDSWLNLIFAVFKLSGYGLIVLGLLLDPLPKRPHHQNGFISYPALTGLPVVYTLLALLAGYLYIRRATVGLERHLKPVGYAVSALALFEALEALTALRVSSNVMIFEAVAPFGPVWYLKHLMLMVSVIFLGRWVFGYLLKRIFTQLFMIFNFLVLIIFLVTTVSFTFLLLRSVEQESLKRTEADVKILNFALSSRQAEILSDAQLVASDSHLQEALINKDYSFIRERAPQMLLAKKESRLAILNQNGQIIARGEEKDRVGDSLSDDPLFKKALTGDSFSSLVIKDGVVAPEISLRGLAPIKSEDKVIGVVMNGVIIDNSFVDSIAKATGLEASVYSGNIVSATTLKSQDGKSRLVGTKEFLPALKETVLDKNQPLSLTISVLNQPYLSSFLPLQASDSKTVGMLMVSQNEIGILRTAATSIEMTFIVTALLLIFSLVPSYFLSKYIARQFE